MAKRYSGEEQEMRRGENTKLGGSDPTFRPYGPQSDPWGRSRPSALVTAPPIFAPSPQERKTGGKAMPIVQKEPTIVKRGIHLEQPVNELLDDYVRFIENRPDHVVNSVLKKMLAKDREYKRWKGQQGRVEPPSRAALKAGA